MKTLCVNDMIKIRKILILSEEEISHVGNYDNNNYMVQNEKTVIDVKISKPLFRKTED